jgi:putative glutamine amidotransferase
MSAKFLLSRPDAQVSLLLKKLGYQEANSSETPDFLVFGGGPDVHPYLYNDIPKKNVYPAPNYDYQDFCTVIAGKLRNIPMLGICRGLQLLHVANGGTLTQHVDGHGGVTHGLTREDGKPLLGWEDIKVNSVHHQCIPEDETGYADLVYYGPGQVTEVLDASNSCGFLGVQFHPEYSNCPEEAVDFFAQLMKNNFEGIL